MKKRLDVLLVERRLAETRQKAKAMILAGNVYVDGRLENGKAGVNIDAESQIEIKGVTMKYVSRGGLKLEKAIDSFGILLDGMVCMDVGASTGGFTDCMLQNGASKVYSVDVGHGQLDAKLRNDDRVVVMEKTNIKEISPDNIDELVSFVSIDVSFISLTKVLLPVKGIMKDGARMVCLIKPQFEAGKERVGKKGVVKEKSVHADVIKNVVDFAIGIGFRPLALDFSPIKGPEGNIEYLLYLENDAENDGLLPFSVSETVEKAHKML